MEKTNGAQQYLDWLCTKKDLDKEVKLFDRILAEFLNNYANIIKNISCSKQ